VLGSAHALLVTRYPKQFVDFDTDLRGLKRRREDFTEEDQNLILKVKSWVLALEKFKVDAIEEQRSERPRKARQDFLIQKSTMTSNSTSTAQPSTTTPDTAMTDYSPTTSAPSIPATTTAFASTLPTETSNTTVEATSIEKSSHKPLPSFSPDSNSWSHDPRNGNICAHGPRLTSFERKIVLLANNHPDRVKDNSSFVTAGE
jgi:hypothetical protein